MKMKDKVCALSYLFFFTFYVTFFVAENQQLLDIYFV